MWKGCVQLMRNKYFWPLTNSKQVILLLSDTKLRKNVIFFDRSAFSNFALYCIIQPSIGMLVDYLCNSTTKLFVHNSSYFTLCKSHQLRALSALNITFESVSGVPDYKWVRNSWWSSVFCLVSLLHSNGFWNGEFLYWSFFAFIIEQTGFLRKFVFGRISHYSMSALFWQMLGISHINKLCSDS